jgi:hypothetical protein
MQSKLFDNKTISRMDQRSSNHHASTSWHWLPCTQLVRQITEIKLNLLHLGYHNCTLQALCSQFVVQPCPVLKPLQYTGQAVPLPGVKSRYPGH